MTCEIEITVNVINPGQQTDRVNGHINTAQRKQFSAKKTTRASSSQESFLLPAAMGPLCCSADHATSRSNRHKSLACRINVLFPTGMPLWHNTINSTVLRVFVPITRPCSPLPQQRGMVQNHCSLNINRQCWIRSWCSVAAGR